jgi:hypothetical protein
MCKERDVLTQFGRSSKCCVDGRGGSRMEVLLVGRRPEVMMRLA